jgi:Ca2+:H+ antiporter
MVLSGMLIFIPIGYVSHFVGMDEPYVFGFNFLAIIPLAWLIGKCTEDLACAVGQMLGGLLNATFGNVVEMLICVAGIRHGEISVVQCTLVGSILSNLLLVLGTAFLVGGISYKVQTYSQQGAATQCTLMMMGVLAIGLPTIYANILHQEEEWEHMVSVSRWSSIFLLITYGAFLYFQLGTHRALFEGEDDGEEEEVADLSPVTAGILLMVLTVVTSFATDFMIHSIKGTVSKWNVCKEFIGIIMLPIIGNAAEHYTAITCAAKNKMDLALGVAAGSSCQMALLVTPFTVLVGWVYGQDMTLDFHMFQLGVLFLSIFLATCILSNGTSNWLEGLMLVTTYLILALIYFFEGSADGHGLAVLY